MTGGNTPHRKPSRAMHVHHKVIQPNKVDICEHMRAGHMRAGHMRAGHMRAGYMCAGPALRSLSSSALLGLPAAAFSSPMPWPWNRGERQHGVPTTRSGKRDSTAGTAGVRHAWKFSHVRSSPQGKMDIIRYARGSVGKHRADTTANRWDP